MKLSRKRRSVAYPDRLTRGFTRRGRHREFIHPHMYPFQVDDRVDHRTVGSLATQEPKLGQVGTLIAHSRWTPLRARNLESHKRGDKEYDILHIARTACLPSARHGQPVSSDRGAGRKCKMPSFSLFPLSRDRHDDDVKMQQWRRSRRGECFESARGGLKLIPKA